MVSFSLRLRISYLLLQDSSLVSFHLIQFAPPENETVESKQPRVDYMLVGRNHHAVKIPTLTAHKTIKMSTCLFCLRLRTSTR